MSVGRLNERQPSSGGGRLKSKPTRRNALAGVPPGRLFSFDNCAQFKGPVPVLGTSKEYEAMIHKKTAGKKLARSRLSLAARMLGDAVRTTLPVPPPEETWRNKKLNSKSGFKR
jgi:hypothetical protein